MKKQILNEEFIRMQKLAGIITENLNEAITLDSNKLKAFTMAVNAFDNEKGSYIALARPKADLPENISNMAKRNFPKEQNTVVNSYLNMLRDLESKQTDDEDDLKNLAVAIGLYEKELLAKIKNI